MGKNRNKLHYVSGVCELEKGEVNFYGGMSGVSCSQVWYHVIYAIKDKFPEIDFWINPQLLKCETLSSTKNYKRYGVCKSFVCTYKPFSNGEVRPKLKLSDLDKKKYTENRAKVDLGVNVVISNDANINNECSSLPSKSPNKTKYTSVEYNKDLNISNYKKLKGKVGKCDNEVIFFAPENEHFTYDELQIKLDLYDTYKDELLNYCDDFSKLTDKIINGDIDINDRYSAIRNLKDTFNNCLVKAKFDLRDIDFYSLCKYVNKKGISTLNDISSKLDISNDAFIDLSDIYCRFNELMLLVVNILISIEDLANKNPLKAIYSSYEDVEYVSAINYEVIF